MEKKKITVIISVTCAVFVCLISLFFIRNTKVKKESVLNVGFYNIPATTKEYIKSTLVENFGGKVIARDYESINFDSKSVKKIDLLFAWKNQETEALEKFAKDIPGKALNMLPNSLKKQSKNYLPLLLNPYVMDYYSVAAENAEIDYPETYEEFEKYLTEISGQVFIPFICNGSDDDTLIALVGALIEATKGTNGYNHYVDVLKNGNILEDELVLETINKLKHWTKIGVMHPLWYMATDSDIDYFMSVNQVGVLFTSLSANRKYPYNIIREYATGKIPIMQNNTGKRLDHGIVGNGIICMNFNSSVKCRGVLNLLVSENIQSGLSKNSALGPTALRGESYDIQADDARFFVAACASGLLTTETIGNNAEQIRNYLKE